MSAVSAALHSERLKEKGDNANTKTMLDTSATLRGKGWTCLLARCRHRASRFTGRLCLARGCAPERFCSGLVHGIPLGLDMDVSASGWLLAY